MITALQNFISKQSKILFPVLLLIIIVSFVLYLSQGSSVFDLLPDPNREPKELYGVDLNDPEQRRIVTLSNRVAADFGAIISPSDEALEKADSQFMANMQKQLQMAFQANQEDVDRNALQQMFGFMQQWPNLPKFIKVREIARSGIQDFEFFESSAQSKISLDGQADQWNFMPLRVNHPRLNLRFDDFLNRLDPGLADDENRTRAMQFTGQRRGFSARDTEAILYSHFRATEVDRTYNEGGLSLHREGELDLHAENFAWDAEAVSVNVDDLNYTNPPVAVIELVNNPKSNSELSINYANKNRTLLFSDLKKDQNGSRVYVLIGKTATSTTSALRSALEDLDFGLEVLDDGNSVILTPEADRLPVNKPQIATTSEDIKISGLLDDQLLAYHDANKFDSVFEEPARTFATSLTFTSADYLKLPPPPDEARMLAYFERNKDQFSPPVIEQNDSNTSIDPKGEKGPVGPAEVNSTDANGSSAETLELNLLSDLGNDLNNSSQPNVTFDQVREEVKSRIIEGDRIDAERYAASDAREAALKFLDEINQLQDLLRNKYPNYNERRNSTELSDLIAKHKVKPRPISFADKDMAVQGAILGLETRESERRGNRQPLEEVKSLSERSFFTRSVRKARDGYVVFIFDRFVQSGPGDYASASFRELYNGYSQSLENDALQKYADELFQRLKDADIKDFSKLENVFTEVKRKNSSGVRSYFDRLNSSLSREIEPLQEELSAINDAERDSNATAEELSRKPVVSDQIEDIREKQARLNRERSLAIRLVDACPSLSNSNQWEELERTDEEVVFARLLGVYTMRAKQQNADDINARVEELEFARAEKARGQLVEDLISVGFAR